MPDSSRPPSATHSAPSTTDREFDRYVSSLASPGRDLDRRMLPANSAVVCHPQFPEEFREDNPENRRRFVDLGFAWSDEARQRVWFADAARLKGSASFQFAVENRRAFVNGVDENLQGAKGAPFPYPKVPLLPFLVPWQPRIRRVTMADLTDRLVCALIECSGSPKRTRPNRLKRTQPQNAPDWPRGWRQDLKCINSLRVYRVTGMRAEVHVVSAYVGSFRLSPEGAQVVNPRDGLETVIRIYEDWLQRNGGPVKGTFFTIATALPEPLERMERTTDRYQVIGTFRSRAGGWETCFGTKLSPRRYLNDFLERLQPVTRSARVARIREFIDDRFSSPLAAQLDNLRVHHLARKINEPRRFIEEAFVELQDSKEYAVVAPKHGDWEIRPRGLPGEHTSRTRCQLESPWWFRFSVSVLIPSIVLATFLLRGYFVHGTFDSKAAAVGLPLCIAAAWISSWIKSFEKKRD